MPPRRNLDREMAVIKDYLFKDSEGNPVFSPVEIANKYKISKQTLYNILDRHSVPHRIVGTNHGVESAVIEDYRFKDSEGKYVFSPVEIADKYKITRTTLYNILDRNGVPPRIPMKKPRPNLLSYSDVMLNPNLLYKMIDEYQSKKSNGHYVYSYDTFLKRNEISSDTWDEICKKRGIQRRNKVSSGACKVKIPRSKNNSIEDLEPQIHEVVAAYNLVDENGEPVYKLRELCSKFGCSPETFYNLLRVALDKHKLRVKFRRGLRN